MTCDTGTWGKGCGIGLTAGTIGDVKEAGGVARRCRWCQEADAHRRRDGVCIVCQQPIAAHFNDRNEKLSCAEVRP